MMSDPTNFTFVGSILEAMLGKVPSENVIVNEYHQHPASGARLIPDDLRKAIEEASFRVSKHSMDDDKGPIDEV